MMTPKPRLKTSLKRYFATGLVSLLPTVAVAYILLFVVGKLNSATQWVMARIEPETALHIEILFPLIFLILAVSLIIIVGVVSTTIVGRGTARVWERVITRIPVLRHVYVAVRQVSTALSLRKKQVFKSVVLVRYPQTGLYQIGFVTTDGIKGFVEGDEVLAVFVPSTPNPMTGFLFMAEREQVTELDLAVDDAFKMVLSGGFVMPGGETDIGASGSLTELLATRRKSPQPRRQAAETTSN